MLDWSKRMVQKKLKLNLSCLKIQISLTIWLIKLKRAINKYKKQNKYFYLISKVQQVLKKIKVFKLFKFQKKYKMKQAPLKKIHANNSNFIKKIKNHKILFILYNLFVFMARNNLIFNNLQLIKHIFKRLFPISAIHR